MVKSCETKVVVVNNTIKSYYSEDHQLFTDMLALKAAVQISIEKQKNVYQSNSWEFNNGADFKQMGRLLSIVDEGFKHEVSSTFLIGGIDRAQMTLVVAGIISTNIPIHGFEILKLSQEASSAIVAGYTNVHIHHMAWGEYSGIIDEESGPVNIITISEWMDLNFIKLAIYTLIDAEGYEPRILRGMRLFELHNQQRFPIIQYELGGTWAKYDKRHGGENEWTQKQAAEYMRSNGYELFIIGENNWMRVDAEFFEEGAHSLDEGRGKFVQGNLLCLHLHFCPPSIMRHVLQYVAKQYYV